MFDQIFPVLPALVVAHAWITMLMVQMYDGMDDSFLLPPEALAG